MRWLLVLVLTSIALAGCTSRRGACEELCTKLVVDCRWTAWASVDQCTNGCVEDLYRRDDVDEVIACYHAAADPPTREAARETVQAAEDAGFFDESIAAGTWDREAAIDDAVQFGTCDPFAAVQCKVEAVTARPDLPLVNDY